MLNQVRSEEYDDQSRPWKGNQQIQKIIEGYAGAVQKRRKKKKKEEGKDEEEEKGRVAIPARQVVEMVEDAEEEMQKEKEDQDGKKIGVVAGQLVQMLFAARASSLEAVEEVERDIVFNEQGSLEFVFRKIKLWRNGEQKSTGRMLPFRRQGRDAIPKGKNRRTRNGQDHFRNRAVRARCCVNLPRAAWRRARVAGQQQE